MMSIGHVSDKGDEEVAEGEENGEAERSVRPRGSQPGVARGPYVKRDMYSALDGTALVALGERDVQSIIDSADAALRNPCRGARQAAARCDGVPASIRCAMARGIRG
jgi:hypothetical protein